MHVDILAEDWKRGKETIPETRKRQKRTERSGRKAPCDLGGVIYIHIIHRGRICPACVALDNIVVFVYRAYNSHAKGHSFILTRRERERVKQEAEEKGKKHETGRKGEARQHSSRKQTNVVVINYFFSWCSAFPPKYGEDSPHTDWCGINWPFCLFKFLVAEGRNRRRRNLSNAVSLKPTGLRPIHLLSSRAPFKKS